MFHTKRAGRAVTVTDVPRTVTVFRNVAHCARGTHNQFSTPTYVRCGYRGAVRTAAVANGSSPTACCASLPGSGGANVLPGGSQIACTSQEFAFPAAAQEEHVHTEPLE